MQTFRTTIVCLAFLFLMIGCTQAPETDDIEQAIRSHFEQRGYRIVELSIGAVDRNPLRDRAYMAPKTFVVEIREITLESMRKPDRPGIAAETGRISARNARLELYSSSRPGRPLEVSSIQGIEVP